MAALRNDTLWHKPVDAWTPKPSTLAGRRILEWQIALMALGLHTAFVNGQTRVWRHGECRGLEYRKWLTMRFIYS